MINSVDFIFELLMDAEMVLKSGDILIKAFAKLGLFVYIEPIIQQKLVLQNEHHIQCQVL